MEWLQYRSGAACIVFEGKIVITGGIRSGSVLDLFKSVEAYDYHDNSWSFLPDMINKKFNHASVSMGNKMFVINGYKTKSCEVFDSFSRKFVFIKAAFPKRDLFARKRNVYCKAITIGCKILVICETHSKTTNLYIYDVRNNVWSKKNRSVVKNLYGLPCAKYFMD